MWKIYPGKNVLKISSLHSSVDAFILYTQFQIEKVKQGEK